MSGNFLTLFSAAAFAAFLICFSILLAPSSKEHLRKNFPARLFAPLAAFYFVPAGSLPPFVSFEYGGFCAALLLFLSSILNAPRGSSRPFADAVAFPFVFCASWGSLAISAYRLGVPGSLASLGTYSAMPLWGVAGFLSRIGMIFLMLALLCSMPKGSRLKESACFDGYRAAAALHSLLCAAFIATLLLPWNLSCFIRIYGAFGFLLDFIFFLAKCALLLCVSRFASRAANCANGGRAFALALIFTFCGAGCIAAETFALLP